MRFPEALTPLREPRFAWYYAARVVSTAGSMMAPVALAFAVLDLPGATATALGVVLAARTVPMVAFLLFGGVVADRFSRATVMQVSNLLAAATQGVVAALVVTGTAELWMVIVLEALNGTVAAFSLPAMDGLIPKLAPRSHLQQANALLSFSRGGMAVVGPTIAAFLVVSVGPGWALAFDALTWLAAAMLVSRVRLRPRERAVETASMFRELREGWSVFVGNTWLWVVVLAFGVLNAIHAGAWFTLGPALAKETVGESGWGLILSAESVGLVLMTVIMLKVRVRFPLRAGMLGMALFSVPLLMLGLDPALLPLIAAAFLAGMGMEVFGIGWSLAMQENIDDDVLSRAYSYDAVGSYVAMPVGQILYGPLGDAFGFRNVLVVSGFAYLAVALLALTSRSVRTLERVRHPSAARVS